MSWVAIDLAALGIGLVVVPLYVDDNAESVAWCVAHAEARLLVVDNSRIAAGLARVSEIALPPIVVLRPDEGETAIAAAALSSRRGRRSGGRPVPLETLATICFTSGTSGRPKGVMLSHGNILANVEQCRQTGMARSDDNFLSILPLSHMFERTGGYYLPLAIGAKVTYCRGIAQIAEDLAVAGADRDVRRAARVRALRGEDRRVAGEVGAEARPVRRLREARLPRRRASGQRARPSCSLPLLRALVAKPVLARLGGRMRWSVVGGAALDPALARTFIGLGLPMLQGYGMTEASPVISVNRDDDNVPESVGPPVPGVEVRLGEAGELLAHGDNVMQGYWRNPEATRAAITEDGWLRTGDLAEIKDGKIYIRGRAKDILVLSNGEKLPPQDVEFAILRDPVFEQVMLVGEGRPYPILLAVSREADEQALLERANERLKSFPRWMRVRRVIPTPEPWSVDNGLLTPTLKLKRPLLVQEVRAGDRRRLRCRQLDTVWLALAPRPPAHTICR